MRVSFGKRIGGIYCGISNNISGGKGMIIALIILCFVIPIVASIYLLYYFFKAVIWCIKKINEATSEWRMLYRVILWCSIAVALLIVGLIGNAANNGRKNADDEAVTTIITTVTTEQITKTTTTKLTTTTEKETTTTTITTTTEVETEEITEVQTEEVVEEVIETEAEIVETEPPTEEVIEETEDPNESITVYKTPTGEKYHYDGNCNGGSYSEISLADALARGLGPCGKCVY